MAVCSRTISSMVSEPGRWATFPTEALQRLFGSIAVIASVDALAWYLDLKNETGNANDP
jgi:hypothetical protein